MDENIGMKYGRMKVLEFHSKVGYLKKYLCLCDCGKSKVVYIGNLKDGKTTSCGCFHKERILETRFKYGSKGNRLYRIWTNMKTRCYNEKVDGFKDYGARGIVICPEWKNDFGKFSEWAMANGYKDNLTIERVDFEGNYEPSNCTWIESKAQSKNRRGNIMITIDDRTETLKEWCRYYGLNYKLVHQRMKKGDKDPLKNLQFYIDKLIEMESGSNDNN